MLRYAIDCSMWLLQAITHDVQNGFLKIVGCYVVLETAGTVDNLSKFINYTALKVATGENDRIYMGANNRGHTGGLHG